MAGRWLYDEYAGIHPWYSHSYYLDHYSRTQQQQHNNRMTRMVSNEPGQPQNNNNIIIVGGGSNNDTITTLHSSTRPSIMTNPATSGSNNSGVAYYAGNAPAVGAQLNNPVAAAVNPSTFGWSGYQVPLPPTPTHFSEAQMRMSAPWMYGAAASPITTRNRAAAPPLYYQPHSPMLQHQSSLGTSMVEARKVEEKAKEDISRKRKYEAADRPAPTGIDLVQVQAPNATDTTNTRAIWQRSNYPPLFSQNSSHYMSPGMAGTPGGMDGSRRVSLLDHPHLTSPRGVAGMSPGAPLYLYPPPPPPAPGVQSYPSSPNPRASLDDTLTQQQQRQRQHLLQLQQWQRQQLQQQLQSPTQAAASPIARQHDVLRTSSFDLPGYRRDMMPDFSPKKKKKKSNPDKRKDNIMLSPKSIHSSDEDYAKALALLRKRYDEASTLSSGRDDCGDIVLIEECDRGLLTDYFYFIMLQLKACRLTEADRTARGDKRRDVPIGFGGIQCIHCEPCPAPRKFFWSDVNRLANSFACIPDHVLTCRMCPKEVTDALLVLKDRHKCQMQSIPRGSQKHCLRKIWKKLHADDNINTGSAT